MVKKLAVIIVLAGGLVAAQAQVGGAAPEIKVKLAQSSGTAGGRLKGEIVVTFAQGLHGYQNPPSMDYMIPVTLKLDGKTKFKLGSVQYPKGQPMNVPGETKPAQVYAGVIHIRFTVVLPPTAGKSSVTFHLGYQECNEQACFPPGDVSAAAIIVVKRATKPAKQ